MKKTIDLTKLSQAELISLLQQSQEREALLEQKVVKANGELVKTKEEMVKTHGELAKEKVKVAKANGELAEPAFFHVGNTKSITYP